MMQSRYVISPLDIALSHRSPATPRKILDRRIRSGALPSSQVEVVTLDNLEELLVRHSAPHSVPLANEYVLRDYRLQMLQGRRFVQMRLDYEVINEPFADPTPLNVHTRALGMWTLATICGRSRVETLKWAASGLLNLLYVRRNGREDTFAIVDGNLAEAIERAGPKYSSATKTRTRWFGPEKVRAAVRSGELREIPGKGIRLDYDFLTWAMQYQHPTEKGVVERYVSDLLSSKA